MESVNELLTISPIVIIGFAGLFVMMLDAFTGNARWSFYASLFFCLAALAGAVQNVLGPTGTSFYSLVYYGGTASFGAVLVLTGTLFSLCLSKDYLEQTGNHIAEVYSLVLFAAFGMLLLVQANHMIVLFLGIESMSIALYALAGLLRDQKKSVEAALKYFLLGAFSTGFLLYGIALLYGSTGSLALPEIAEASDKGVMYWAGVGLLFTGFFFKVSAVPFHMWTPDVYQGSPTTVTAFMATASKSAAFVAFILVLSRALPDTSQQWQEVLWIFAVFTMVIGNLLALVQENIKRMLAYSSIAHAGYIMVGLAATSGAAYSAVLYYLFAYTLMNVGAFGVVAYYECHKNCDFTEIKNYAGLGFKKPIMGILMSVFLFSMVGIPPFAGFIGKYRVFAAAIDEGLISLVIIGVLASAISVYYYLSVLVYLYMKEDETGMVMKRPSTLYSLALIILALLTIYFGVHPGLLTDFLGSFYSVTW
ncbi:NADH-quinone oxidoreductase subunit N [Balneolaceae bacterium ANBcel3]|nr:NADH-quinone oxidoreductase subunit N [Balneolaceae bacterium ANBcel3]